MFLQLQPLICGGGFVFFLVPAARNRLSAGAFAANHKKMRVLHNGLGERGIRRVTCDKIGVQRAAAASQPGSNKLSRRVGWRSVIAQVDELRVVFNRRVWRPRLPLPPCSFLSC